VTCSATTPERANHWVVGICFILLALSGLAFFHPAFFPLTQLFGGGPGPASSTLHRGGDDAVLRGDGRALLEAQRVEPRDKEWLRVRKMVDGNDHDMPEQGKYNGGQKVLFWGLVIGMVILFLSGLLMWRAWWTPPVTAVRLASLLHAVGAVWMIGLIIMHVYAAIWTRGTIRAMLYGTVTRAWAKQHHRGWYRQMTGDKS
jgi:formate dehydrogenase subunit gamma